MDDRVYAETGVRLVDLLVMCQRIVEQAYQRIFEHFRRLHPVAKARSIPALCKALSDSLQDAQALEAVLTGLNPGITLADAKEQMLHYFHLLTPDIYTFTPDDFLAAYPNPTDQEALLSVLRRWSLRFGELADQTAQHFFLNNPIWTRPMIRLEGDRFFCPIPDLFHSFGLEMMEAVIRDHPALWEAYGQRRGRYLEDETARLFTEAFPSATIFQGSQWRDPDDPAVEWENDLLVLLDAYLIVVEAKAGRLADRARRGDIASLRREIAELLVHPSQQSSRFAEYLARHPQLHRFNTRRGIENVVDTRAVRRVIRLNVTLNSLGSIGSRWPALNDAEFVAALEDLAPTIALADLLSIFELLDGQCQKLHYLVRRAEFERHAVYDGDEIDLLALYVQTGFNMGEVEFTRVPLWISDKHESLESFFMHRTTGTVTKRPQFAMSRWWRDLVAMVEERRAPRWTMAGLQLLNVSHQDQFRFERRFKGHQHIVRTCWKNPRHQDMVFGTFGPPQRRQTVVGLAHRCLSKAELRDKIQYAGEVALERTDMQDVLVIGVNVEEPHPPASIILHMSKVDLPSEEKTGG